MNCSLLDDDTYIREVTAKLPVWLAEGRSDLSDNRSIWDWIKFNIITHAVQHSKRKARERKETENILQKEFTGAKQKFESDATDENAVYFNWANKDKLERFYEEKLQGIIIRARTRWCEYGEKSSKYFLNLEKRNHVKKHVRKLESVVRPLQTSLGYFLNKIVFIKSCIKARIRMQVTRKQRNPF